MLDQTDRMARHLLAFPTDRRTWDTLDLALRQISVLLAQLEETSLSQLYSEVHARVLSRDGNKEISSILDAVLAATSTTRQQLDHAISPRYSSATTDRIGDTPTEGLDAADAAFRALNAATSRLVQLLTDELVPLGPHTLHDLEGTADNIQASLAVLARWNAPVSPVDDWILDPPFLRAGVKLDQLDDLTDVENVERLRRSLELVEPRGLALRAEPAKLLVDALLSQLRQR